MPLALLYVLESVLTKFCATAPPDRPGQSASMLTDTGLTGTLNWVMSCVALATHASDGAVVGIVLPAVNRWISSVEKKNVLLCTMGPPSEKPYWLLRMGLLSAPGTATGELAD